jgi:hypothetical protein
MVKRIYLQSRHLAPRSKPLKPCTHAAPIDRAQMTMSVLPLPGARRLKLSPRRISTVVFLEREPPPLFQFWLVSDGFPFGGPE